MNIFQTEDTLIEFICNSICCAKMDSDLVLCARITSEYGEFKEYVQRVIGGQFTDPVYRQLDWDYLAHFWWKEGNNRRLLPVPSQLDDTIGLEVLQLPEVY